MPAEAVLVTGANGEIGHGLIPALFQTKKYAVIALDLHELDEKIKPFVHQEIVADILDKKIIENLFTDHKISTVFHLAALLSTSAEKNPELAHDVNVNGTKELLSAANSAAQKDGSEIKFIFPSSIAVYGLPNSETKKSTEKVKESEFNNPITIYGINKLYCELLGTYYSNYYNLLEPNSKRLIDFRAIRFPGIISAMTLPKGGTSDYAPEMIHGAAKGEGYESFVRPDSQIPFMVMPDAVKALIQINETPKAQLSQQMYNVSSFSVTAEQIAQIVNGAFPDSSVSYSPDENRQKIIDSWPSDIDDSKARTDWGWQPDYDLNKAFKEYLIPEIQMKYKNK